MRLLNLPLLDQFVARHASARGVLAAWRREVKAADWKSPQDIKDRYRTADFLDGNRVIFNIKGNAFRLVVQVQYQDGIVRVQWVGTHAGYSKRRF